MQILSLIPFDLVGFVDPFPGRDPLNSDRMRDFDSEILFYLLLWFHFTEKIRWFPKRVLFHIERSGNEMSLRSNEKWDFWRILPVQQFKKYYYLTPNFILLIYWCILYCSGLLSNDHIIAIDDCKFDQNCILCNGSSTSEGIFRVWI